uniref:Uncharacterized protein n=1 Tax=Vespula pensylvanica TaxID=30213 RepID=A0A834PDZ6_VESPE|nr:hypothetical protein H0235_000181 [Vespula pensylvanica]
MEKTSLDSLHFEEMQLTRREVFIILGDKLFCPVSEAIKKIENSVSTRFACSYILPDDMKKICRNLFYSFRRKWRQVKRRKYFFTKYEKWLNVTLTFYKPPVVSETSRSEHCNTASNSTDSSNSCKRRRIEDIPSCSYSTELSSVPQTRNIVLESSRENENRVPPTRNIILESSRENENRRRFKDLTTVSDDYALSLLLEIKLLKHQYEVLRATNIENNCNIYPPYKAVLQAKEKCYPPKTDIKIKDCSAEVKLQGLLDHSVEQILFIQRDFLKSSTSEYISNMTLYCKWGYAEISGENIKSNFNGNRDTASNTSLFSISIVPLQLISTNPETRAEYIIWENQRPSSARFCRPIKLQFNHGNSQNYTNDVDYIKEQERNLVSFITVFDGKLITVSYNLKFVMTNSQVCNAVTSTSEDEHCHLCKVVKNRFNNIQEILRKEIEHNYCFGLSVLHIWIRFFECCLDLSYKLDIKKSKVCSEEEKSVVENRKRNIQIGLNLQYGFMVDNEKAELKDCDENTARCFFENSTTSALITGVDRILLKRLCVILQAMSSNYKINATKFHNYALKTAERFVKLYPWYNMSITVHKILIHGPEVIESALLPIGQLCNDVQHDLYVDRSCQDFVRVKNMEEVFLQLLATSDPYISCLRNLPQTKLKNLMTEAINLLTLPDIMIEDDDGNTSDEDNDDSDLDD